MPANQFTMTTLTSPDASSLGEVRVPAEAVYAAYKPVKALEMVPINGRSLVQFAFTGAFGKLLIDPESGEVMETRDGSTTSTVNSSLEKFADCLKFFTDLLSSAEVEDDPRDGDEGEDEDEDEALAQRLEAGIRKIDSRAFREDSYWYEIRWAVSLGDYT
ncbi:SUKH-4 family immunity protein [Streptomyces sp. NPDC048179]|uniref:SUKH-4 family immunity protein n=1 Tax=Streptomyces sp. NPDC048179 TaxID=3365506 RepID=UPI00371826E6